MGGLLYGQGTKREMLTAPQTGKRKNSIARRPMMAMDVKRVMINDHLVEIDELVKKLAATKESHGDISVIPRLLEIHMSMAIFYVRRLSHMYSVDVDIATSNYMLGMLDACLRVSRGEAPSQYFTKYMFSRARSFVINGLENPSTGWGREDYRYAKATGRPIEHVISVDAARRNVASSEEAESSSSLISDLRVSYIDDSIPMMIEAEDLVKSLSAKQQTAITLFAKGYTDAEAARELGWSRAQLMSVKSEIIAIMERRVRRRPEE